MKAAILGYGKSGKSAEKFLRYKGIVDISIFDDRLSGFKKLEDFENIFDVVIASPGIKLSDNLLNTNNLTSEIELIASEIDFKKIICVTGTNGKSTVTFLTSQILNLCGIKSSYCGNIGNTFTYAFFDEKPDIYVLELSSFQIELLKNFKTLNICITNIAPDHLDRYENYEEYVDAKYKIIKHLLPEGFVIINKDNEFKNLIDEGLNIIEVDESLNEYPILKNNILDFGNFFADISKFKLFGIHNLVNLSFSLLLANRICEFNGDVTNIISHLKGLEHRCEFVKEINGVRYLNDSKGTNVYSTLTALQGVEKNTILILGGKDKGGHFDILAHEINEKVKEVILFGEASDKIFKQLKNKTNTPIIQFDQLKDVIEYVFGNAIAGDTVLFSPACASFDQFKNFEERGRTFKNFIYELKENA